MSTTGARAILSFTLLSIVGCDDAGSGATPASTPAASEKAPSKTGDAPAPVAAAAPAAPAPATAPNYAVPPDVCALADPSLLGPEVGTGEGSIENETIKYETPGCTFLLMAPDGVNTLKVFAAVNGDSAAHFTQVNDVWNGDFVPPGFVATPIADLGAQAVYAMRLTAENRRIEQTLAFYEKNLFIEVRFMGGGNKEWDAATMRERILKLARHVMSKVPKA